MSNSDNELKIVRSLTNEVIVIDLQTVHDAEVYACVQCVVIIGIYI